MSDADKARTEAQQALEAQGEQIAEMTPQELGEYLDSCESVDQDLASEVVAATRELRVRRN